MLRGPRESCCGQHEIVDGRRYLSIDELSKERNCDKSLGWPLNDAKSGSLQPIEELDVSLIPYYNLNILSDNSIRNLEFNKGGQEPIKKIREI